MRMTFLPICRTLLNLWILMCLPATFLSAESSKPNVLRIVDVQVRRIDRDNVAYSLKIVNESTLPVYLEGSKFDEPVPFPLYLEQWKNKIGWQIVAPCVDLAPGDVIKMEPGNSLSVEDRLGNPLPSVCRVRNVRFLGKFRFRLDYFVSEIAARNHEENFFSSARGPTQSAVSAPFQFPRPNE